jgi:cell division protein FtsW
LISFAVIVYRGIRAAASAVDEYGVYLATGITMFVGVQAFINLAVAMGMLPTKGLVLPFISYGGSSLLVNCAAIGIVLNVSRAREPQVRPAELSAAPARDVERGAAGRIHGRTISGGTA